MINVGMTVREAVLLASKCDDYGGDEGRGLRDRIIKAIELATGNEKLLVACNGVERLRLTDAEREAVEAAERCLLWQSAVEAESELRDDRAPHRSVERAQSAAILRGLLDRTGGNE